MLFSQRFFCQALLLPPCTVPCKIGSADLDTCANHFNLSGPNGFPDSASRSDYIVSDVIKRMYKVIYKVINIHPSFAFQDNLLFDVYIMIALMIGFRIISFLFLLMRAYKEQWFGQTSSLLRSWEAKLDLQDNEFFLRNIWKQLLAQRSFINNFHENLARNISSAEEMFNHAEAFAVCFNCSRRNYWWQAFII